MTRQNRYPMPFLMPAARFAAQGGRRDRGAATATA